MRNSKWSLVAIVGGFVLVGGTALMLTRGSQKSPNTVAVTDKILAIGVTRGIAMNPRAANDIESTLIFQLTERTLFTCRDGQPKPDLAEEVPSLQNGAYRIRLKPAEVFTDGSKVTSDDVVASLTSLSREAGPHADTWKTWIAGVEKSDDGGVLVKTRKASPFALGIFCHPFTAIGKVTEGSRVSAGAYTWRRTSETELELASTDAALPKIKLIEYADAPAALRALEEGKVDLDLAELAGAKDSVLPSGLSRATVDDRSISMIFYAPKQDKNNRAVVAYLRGALATEDFVKEMEASSRPTLGALPEAKDGAGNPGAAAVAASAPVNVRFTTPASEGAQEFSKKLAARLETGNIKLEHIQVEPEAFGRSIDERKLELWGAVLRSPYDWPFETVDACKKYSPAYLKYPKTNEILAKIEKSTLTDAFGLLTDLNAALLEESYCVPVARQSLSLIARTSDSAQAAAANLLNWARTAPGT